MTFQTRRANTGSTVGIRLIARETVAVETRARRAISRISICPRESDAPSYHDVSTRLLKINNREPKEVGRGWHGVIQGKQIGTVETDSSSSVAGLLLKWTPRLVWPGRNRLKENLRGELWKPCNHRRTAPFTK